jgi:hypothetical protein
LKHTTYWLLTSSLKGWGYALAAALLAHGLFQLIRPSDASTADRRLWQKFSPLLDGIATVLIAGMILLTFLLYTHSTYPVIVSLTPWLVWTAAFCLIVAAVAVAIRAMVLRSQRRPAAQPVLRPHGAMPILLTLVLVLGLGFGGLLRWQEHRAIIQLDPTGTCWLDQIQFSRYRLLAEWMQKQPSPLKP